MDDQPAGQLQDGQFSLDTVPAGTHKFLVKADHAFGFTFNSANNIISPSALTAGLGGTLILVGNAGGKMQIACNRSGLTLQLDGKDAGGCSTKPIEATGVTLGRHNLEVYEGAQSLGSRTVELGPATNLGVYLLGESSQGLVTITSNVEDFNINFDRHESTIPGKRGRWRRSLAPGEHVISAHKDGFTVAAGHGNVASRKRQRSDPGICFYRDSDIGRVDH